LRLFVRPAAPVRIYVVAPNGRVSRYTVDLSSTVGALKERITQRLFIPTQSQILFYGVSRLSRDSSTLFSYHLRNYAVVRLVQITSTFIPIFVQPARGERVSFDVNPTIQTVYQLKTLVQQRLSISPARQRLIFRGKELRNPFLLVRYNVNRGDTLHLVTVDEKKTTDRFDRFFEPYQCKCNNILHLFLID
jgi:ubiquitin C